MSQRLVLTKSNCRSLKAAKPKAKRSRKTREEYAARFAVIPEVPPVERLNLFPPEPARVVARLRLPLAPSVNHYWRSWVQGGAVRVLVSAEGRAYADAVAIAWLAHWKGRPPEPARDRLRLKITVHYYTALTIDLDNRVKPLQDALSHAGAWVDDSQIDVLQVVRGVPVQAPGCMEVTIETIPFGGTMVLAPTERV